MVSDYTISIFLDTRRAKETGLYPVKLRVFSSSIKKARLYQTDFDLSERAFESIWLTTKPRNEHKELRLKLEALKSKANEAAGSIMPFTFDQFKKKLYQGSGQEDNVFYQYELKIKELTDNKQIGTAELYSASLRSIKEFISEKYKRELTRLSFLEVNRDFLRDYERFMINDKERSRTTVSMYLRTLRTLYNKAKIDNKIYIETYPFGKTQYKIPNVKKVKKAFNKEELKKLNESVPATPEQQKSKDFWFLSYNCNGMNIKDIALLTNKQLNDDTIEFLRAKTINTANGELKPVKVYLNDYSKNIIEKYRIKENTQSNDYVFDIVSKSDDDKEKHKKIKNFTRFINQHLKTLAEKNGLKNDVSTYWARHSFATNAIRKGASMEFVMEALSHNDLKTTANYFAGFHDDDKKEFMQSLMDF